MGWVCKYCSTNNDDAEDCCITCDRPKSYGRETLTKAEADALRGERITVPEKFGVIGGGAFKGRTDIKSVTLHGNVTKIMQSAFEGCTNLSEVCASHVLASVEDRAFWDCKKLTVSNRPRAAFTNRTAYGYTYNPLPEPSRTAENPSEAPRRSDGDKRGLLKLLVYGAIIVAVIFIATKLFGII